jgi:hypothetical protein
MKITIFAQLEFWLLTVFSLVLPVGIYWVLFTKKAISRVAVLFFGLSFVAIACIDLYLLRALSANAKHLFALQEDAIFISELTIALYLLPALFAGIGVNIISHVLIRHLVSAESKFDKQHPHA